MKMMILSLILIQMINPCHLLSLISSFCFRIEYCLPQFVNLKRAFYSVLSIMYEFLAMKYICLYNFVYKMLIMVSTQKETSNAGQSKNFLGFVELTNSQCAEWILDKIAKYINKTFTGLKCML